jgi:two-component system sensor histidine kinase RegB
MKVVFSDSPSAATPSTSLGLAWLVRLRWVSLAAQVVVLAVGQFAFALPFSVPAVLVLVFAGLATNIGLHFWARGRNEPHPVAAGLVLVLDVLLLTVLLVLSGGPMNPFSVFYIVHVALGALLLGLRWTFALAALTSACFGSLFLLTPPASLHALHRGEGFMTHLYGMWVSYALVALVVGTFVSLIASSLSRRERQLSDMRDRVARQEKLASLTTLAAGAAHELGSPLGTIALIAGDLTRLADDPEHVRQDAALLRQEAQRCHTILRKLAADAGATQAEAPRTMPLAELPGLVLAELPAARRERIETHVHGEGSVALAPGPFTQVVTNLLQNALDASEGRTASKVSLSLRLVNETLEVTVEDHGIGMSEDELRRLGEPFFTTKQPGAGLGLGFFIARTFAEHFRGQLTVDSEAARGTRVCLTLPRTA